VISLGLRMPIVDRCGPHVLADAGSVLPLQGDVGFDSLPDQLVNKWMNRGFDFNMILIGETGCGKSTLIDSLFNANFEESSRTHTRKATEVFNKSYDIEENNVRVRLNIAETLGMGDQIDRTTSIDSVRSFIHQQFEMYLQEELHIKRAMHSYTDSRVHVCLYFINPTGHGLKSLDLVMLKELSVLVNVIPVISKADTITKPNLARFKQQVMKDLQDNQVLLYELPIVGDDGVSKSNIQLSSLLPFAIVGSRTLDGNKRVRSYPWGRVEIENEEHCDFIQLREAVLRLNMTDLIAKTQDEHYSVYRAQRLKEMGFLETTEGDRDASLQDTYMAKREEQQKLQKEREVDLRNTFSKKVRQKQLELDQIRKDLKQKYEAKMSPLLQERQLIAEKKEKLDRERGEFLQQMAAQTAGGKVKKGMGKKHSTFFGNE